MPMEKFSDFIHSRIGAAVEGGNESVNESVEKYNYSGHSISVKTEKIAAPSNVKGLGNKVMYRLFTSYGKNGKLFEIGAVNGLENTENMYITYIKLFDDATGDSYGRKLLSSRKIPYNDSKSFSWLLGRIFMEEKLTKMFGDKSASKESSFVKIVERLCTLLISLSR